jgi:hypothetical protein
MSRIEVLLEQIHDVKAKYNKLNQQYAIGFNIFSILLKSNDEVNLHSKFIYELLNPQGSHQQGRLFLDLFLEQLGIELNETTAIEAFREKDNLDILLQTSDDAIIIENKVDTQDHSFQLSRYWESVQSQGYRESNIHLIYLTLWGEKPLESDMQDKVLAISYRKEIVLWLENAIEKVAHIAVLKETLEQYLSLIQVLTKQMKQDSLDMELKELLLKEDNLQQVIALESIITEVKIEVQLEFWQTLLANLFPHYAFGFYNLNNDKGLEESIRRYYELQKNGKDYGIQYQVDNNLYFFVELRNNLYYGFYFEDEAKIQEEQQGYLENLGIEWYEQSNGVYWKYPKKRLDFKTFNHQNVFDLLKNETKAMDIENLSSEIISLIQGYEAQKEQAC